MDSAAAFRTMLNGTAREIAIDRAKCLYREWSLINRVEDHTAKEAAARKEEFKRYQDSVLLLENKLYWEQQTSAKLRPWATIGKVTVGLGFILGGAAIYNATR